MSLALLMLLGIPLLTVVLLFVGPRHQRVVSQRALTGASASLLVAVWIALAVARREAVAQPPYLVIDALGALMILITATVGWASTWFAGRHLAREVERGLLGFRRVRQHYALLLLFLLTLFIAAATPNLMLMWVAIEATTLVTALLISFYHRPTATEAAWKYLVINSVGLLMSLSGILLFMSTLTHWAFPFLDSPLVTTAADPLVIKIAFIFTLIGYGTKAGMAPLHVWLPEAHPAAPASISAIMSTAMLNIALMALLRLKMLTDAALTESFTAPIILGFSVLSLLVAAALIVSQRDYKRLIAYSSIEHTGLILFGIALGPLGTFIALLHMIYHSLVKAALFLASGSIFVAYTTSRISGVRGLLRQHPLLAGVTLAAVIAVVGLPPFGLFVTELSLILAGFGAHPWLVVAVVVALAVAFAGFMRHTSAMVFSAPATPSAAIAPFTVADVLPIITLLAVALVTSWYIPSWLTALLTAASHAW